MTRIDIDYHRGLVRIHYRNHSWREAYVHTRRTYTPKKSVLKKYRKGC